MKVRMNNDNTDTSQKSENESNQPPPFKSRGDWHFTSEVLNDFKKIIEDFFYGVIELTLKSFSSVKVFLVQEIDFVDTHKSSSDIRSKNVGAWFALFFGNFGLDCFYLNQRKRGITIAITFFSIIVLGFIASGLVTLSLDQVDPGPFHTKRMGAYLAGVSDGYVEQEASHTFLGILASIFLSLRNFIFVTNCFYAFVRCLRFFAMDQQRFDLVYNGGKSSVLVMQSQVSMADELHKLSRLKNSGALTEQDYQIAKEIILKRSG